MISKDQGASFSFLGSANLPVERRNCDEHMLVERKDGSLMMLIRTAGHGIGRTISTDGGKTWGKVEDYLAQTTSRFYIRRLLSGNLLLVKHGGINERAGRSHLTAYLSEDDGESWIGGLLLDERGSVSYPDGTQAPDGTIYVIYDWERARDKNILMTTFREEDVRRGEYSSAGRQRVLINFATGKNPRLAKMEQERNKKLALKDNADAAPLITAPRAKLDVQSGESAQLKSNALIFNNRSYNFAKIPAPLTDRFFIRGSLDKGASAKCIEPGVVYVLTPVAERNRDSIEKTLLKQGFVKAAVAEFPLWGAGAANVCSVYQKELKAGDTLSIGKWGVIVY